MPRRILAALAAVFLIAGQTGSALAAVWTGSGGGGPASSAPIQKGLVESLDAGTADKFVVEFASKADLRAANKVTGHAARGKFVVDTLTGNAKKSQTAAVALAKKHGVKAESYWLYNEMIVTGGSKLAAEFAKLPGVSAVRAVKIYPLVKPVDVKARHRGHGRRPRVGRREDPCARGVGLRRLRPGRRRRERRHRRRVHARGARQPVPRQQRRRHVRAQLQLVGSDGNLRRRALRQRRPRHPHDGHDGRWRRARPVHPGRRRRPGRTLDRRQGLRGLRLLGGRAPLVRPVDPRPDRSERRQPRSVPPPGHRQQLVGLAVPATRSISPRSRPGARPGSSRSSRPAIPAPSAAKAARPATSSSPSAPARPTSTTTSPSSRAAARRSTARSTPTSAPRALTSSRAFPAAATSRSRARRWPRRTRRARSR